MPANQSTPEVTRAEEARRLIEKLAAADIDVSGTAAIGITFADIIDANGWLAVDRIASTDMAGAGEKCALPPKGWSCTRTPGHDGPCAAVPNDNSLEDEIAEALTDSLDMDWTSSVGARHVMALLREKGIVS